METYFQDLRIQQVKERTETVISNFTEFKNTFDLEQEEVENLRNLLLELLLELYQESQLICLDINQLSKDDIYFYTFTFENVIQVKRESEGKIAYDCIRFMQAFTDCNGDFLSFNKLDKNGKIFQFNFSIS